MIAHTLHARTPLQIESDDKNMVAMPLFHVGGSSYIQGSIHDGMTSIMTREADGASLVGALMAGATRAFLVPAVLSKVMEMGPDAIKLFGQLRTFAYGAAPMPPALLATALKEFPNLDFVQVYGLTEVCGAITILSPEAHRDESHPERLVSAGQPAEKVEVRVVNPDTLADVESGQPGELWFRTPQLMEGYHNKPEATAETITADGWFRTGDIGRVDDGGFIFVEDRLKDMIISGGENIYSREVEEALLLHPSVLEAAVIGIPDAKWGETVKAFVAFKPAQAASAEELQNHCRSLIAHYKGPRSIEVMAALPRILSTNKIDKRALRAPYWPASGRQVA
jgi:acyl-CoA synthetase (AMP-forming)/AMP-acid ligase II